MNAYLARDHDGIYDVLVEECGAPEGQDYRTDFAVHFPACVEYRFGGALGFGGKVWWSHDKLYVTCYPEDRTLERDTMIEHANARLASFVTLIDR